LYHFPTRYSNISEIKKISDLTPGDVATVYGKVSKLKTKKGHFSKIPMAEGEVEDLSGKIKITWFNQAYLAKMLHDGENVKLTGKVTQGKSGVYLANPEFEKIIDMPIDVHDSLFTKENKDNTGFSYPIYAETRGITSKWFYHAIDKIFKEKTLDNITDYMPGNFKQIPFTNIKNCIGLDAHPKKQKGCRVSQEKICFRRSIFNTNKTTKR
jgi:ATP-dependent DNA helicase RecG